MGRSNLIGLCLFALCIALAPVALGNTLYQFIPLGALALMAIGLSLLMGYAGQISLGQSAFYAVGAYTSALCSAKLGWSPWVTIPLSAVLAAGVALLVGMPSLRLRGHYLAMATLAFGEIVRIVLDGWITLTGGSSGIRGGAPLTVGWPGSQPLVVFNTLTNERAVFYLVWTVAFLGLVLALNLIHSRVGRALRAIHDGEEAAVVLGVPTARYKIQIFVLSAVYASLAGSLYAHSFSYLTPDEFGSAKSILLVVMVVVGGMRTVWGAVVGTLLMGSLTEWLSWMENYWLVVYGVVLLVITMFVPQGILLGAGDFSRWLYRKIVRKKQSGEIKAS
ncbi:MAG TPA: branched-chain amino acid ABC transporter permease [Candidatus Sumerlaeota bacterium]|nr:branched-chain amino acid ABC transporter permease [Candidatus Sumerlaeota bacterium]